MYWDADGWKVDDKEWMQRRKIEWKYVQANLKRFSSTTFDGPYVKAHKELFFKGTVDFDKYDEFGGEVFDYALPVFVMWYHPKLTVGDIKRIIDFHCVNIRRAKMLAKYRKLIQKLWAQSIVDLDEAYGLFGGREEIIIKALWGEPGIGAKFDNLSELETTIQQTDKVMLNSPILSDFYWGSINAVLRDGKKHRYAPGQFLFKHMLTVADKLDDFRLEYIALVANNTLYFEQSPHAGKGNQGSEDMRDHLLELYRTNQFPEKIAKVWKEVEKADTPCFDE